MPSDRGWLSIAAYIVGTPWKIVTRSFSMTSSAFVGVEAGDQGQAGAGDRRGVEADGQAEDVEERQAAHDDVVGGHLLDRAWPSAAR